MATREQKRIADFKHIVKDVFLINNEICYELLKLIGINSVRNILEASPKDFRNATYTDDNDTTIPISAAPLNELIALSVYIKWGTSSGAYSKVTRDDLEKTMDVMIFRTSSGSYSFDHIAGKMILVAATRATPTTATSLINPLPQSRSAVSEWNKGVQQEKGIAETRILSTLSSQDKIGESMTQLPPFFQLSTQNQIGVKIGKTPPNQPP
jgi:hypothetical protein